MSQLSTKTVKLGDSATQANNFLIKTPAVPDGTLSIGRETGVSVLTVDANNSVGVVTTARNAPITDNDLIFDLASRNNFAATPTASGTLTFTNIAAAIGQSGTIILTNTAGYTISKNSSVKVDASFLSVVSSVGSYRLGYYCDGTNVYVTTSASLS